MDSEIKLPKSSEALHRLEAEPELVRDLLEQVTERILSQLATLDQQPASDLADGSEVADGARESWPPEPEPFGDLLELLFERLAPSSFNNPGPGFMAYIPGGGLLPSAVADLIAGTLNRYVTVWAAAPGLVQLEMNVIRWFCSIVGYPEDSGGFLSSGGSIANLSALVAARRDRLPENFLRGTLYASNQTHHSVAKAALIAGFPSENVRHLEVDSRYRIRAEDLEEQVDRDRRAGFLPFLVVGNAGTTNTGAIDPLPDLADIAARESLWLHVDAAYGGFFCLTERGKRRLAGIERADSITLDPHKGLFLPYGTGCLLARDVQTLRNAHSVDADYMPPMQGASDRVDFSEISPELSRSFRGLRVWLPFKLLGVEPFTASLDEKLDLAEWIETRLESIDGLVIVARSQLSILAFRLVHPGWGEEETEARNQRFLAAINRRQRVLLTSTRLEGRFVLRICVLNFRTQMDRMQQCFEDIVEAVSEVSDEAGTGASGGPD